MSISPTLVFRINMFDIFYVVVLTDKDAHTHLHTNAECELEVSNVPFPARFEASAAASYSVGIGLIALCVLLPPGFVSVRAITRKKVGCMHAIPSQNIPNFIAK